MKLNEVVPIGLPWMTYEVSLSVIKIVNMANKAIGIVSINSAINRVHLYFL